MSTVKIKHGDVRQFILDLKQWNIRHYPFSKAQDGIEVRLFPNPKVDWILLKYPNIVDSNS